MSDRLKFQYWMGRIGGWLESPIGVPIALFVIAFAGYGLLINRLGYYWDDFPLAFISNTYGSAGLVRYFSTNRPFWGLLYQITFSILDQPWQWQITALLVRWLSAVSVWLLIREIWPKPKYIAIWVSMLFLVYPGFKQQHIAVIYSNLLIILDCFLLSLYFNIKAVRQSGGVKPTGIGWLWHSIALLFSLINLLTLEYFYMLDLIRPVLIWYVLKDNHLGKWERIRSTLFNWIPYLTLWGLVTIWRTFFFNFQTHNYQFLLIDSFRASPFKALLTLFKEIGSSLWVVLVEAWLKVFQPPNLSQVGIRTTSVMVAIVLILSGMICLYLWFNRNGYLAKVESWSLIIVGIIVCILGGVPWWLTELPPTLRFPSDRFTLPFILGASLVMAGIIAIIPIKNGIKIVVLGLIIGLTIGSQFLVTNQFRRDWETQRRFFWQLAWRMPGIEPGTTLMVNDLPVTYYSDNSLTAPLNWFWTPDSFTQDLAYLLMYPSQRLGKSLVTLTPDHPITIDYLAAKFKGNTSQVVSVFYEPPACLRVLDNAIDIDNRMIPIEMQAAAAISSIEWINPIGPSAEDILPEELYAEEPIHAWCYYFELADLARQQGKWEDVAYFGDIAYNLNDYPNDPSEHFPFIEGYAHTGNWIRAEELTDLAQQITPMLHPLLCRLWQRIDETTTESDEKNLSINSVYSQLKCMP